MQLEDTTETRRWREHRRKLKNIQKYVHHRKGLQFNAKQTEFNQSVNEIYWRRVKINFCFFSSYVFLFPLPPHATDGLITPIIVVPPLDVTLIRNLALAISFLLFLFNANHVPRSFLF